jgi:hypothetical protein
MIVLFRNFRIKRVEKKLKRVNDQLAYYDKIGSDNDGRDLFQGEFDAICLRSFYIQHIEILKTS